MSPSPGVRCAEAVRWLGVGNEPRRAAASCAARHAGAVATSAAGALRRLARRSLQRLPHCWRAVDVEFSDVLSSSPSTAGLLLRAGTGWREGSIGRRSSRGSGGLAIRPERRVLSCSKIPSWKRVSTCRRISKHMPSSASLRRGSGRDDLGCARRVHAQPREFSGPMCLCEGAPHVLATALERSRVEEALRKSEEHFRR